MLEALLRRETRDVAIAVSGGLDSVTLMAVAARLRPRDSVRAFHAVSPAVPEEATARLRALALARDWRLMVFEGAEFADPAYRSNPLNRCYYCKSNLFRQARSRFGAETAIATGTNRDDLSDFRPGLEAAREFEIWHPFVAAGIGKAEIRKIAEREGLPRIAALPAQPCLASRITTGLRVEAPLLTFVHEIERHIARRLGPGDHRCRIRPDGVEVQLDGTSPVLDPDSRAHRALRAELADRCARAGRPLLAITAYRKGSAFVRRAP